MVCAVHVHVVPHGKRHQQPQLYQVTQTQGYEKGYEACFCFCDFVFSQYSVYIYASSIFAASQSQKNDVQHFVHALVQIQALKGVFRQPKLFL